MQGLRGNTQLVRLQPPNTGRHYLPQTLGEGLLCQGYSFKLAAPTRAIRVSCPCYWVLSIGGFNEGWAIYLGTEAWGQQFLLIRISEADSNLLFFHLGCLLPRVRQN